MKPTSIVWTVAVVAVLFGAEEAWRERGRARQLEDERARLISRRSAGEALRREARSHGDELEKERQKLKAELDRLRSQRTSDEGNAKPVVSTPPLTEMSLNALELSRQAFERQKDPVAQLRQLQTAREKMSAEYAPLFRQLGFTPAQIGSFLDAAGRHYEQRADLSVVVMAQNLSADDPGIGRLKAQMDFDYQAELRTLLGNENYSRVIDYERVRPIRPLVSSLAGTALVQGIPLTSDQSEQLVQAVADGSRRYREGGMANGQEEDWDAVDAKAATILSSAQMELFKYGAPGRYTYRLVDVIMRAREEEKASDAGH